MKNTFALPSIRGLDVIRGSKDQSIAKPRLWPALFSSLLLWLCFFPVNWGWLAWVSLVPLLILVRSDARPRRIYFTAWLVGLAFFVPALQWMRVADPMMYVTWIALAVYVALYFPAAVFFTRLLDRHTRMPLLIGFPAAWTALEFARAYALGGFAWYYMAHTQHDVLPLIQISDIGGSYLVSFLIVAVNAFVFQCLSSRFPGMFSPSPKKERPGVRTLAWRATILAITFAAVLSYGYWRLSETTSQPGPTVALIQGSLPQQIRNAAGSPDAAERYVNLMLEHYDRLCDEASHESAELIVWPETSFLYGWSEISRALPENKIPPAWQEMKSRVKRRGETIAARWKTNVLLGVNETDLGSDLREHRYNTAILVDRTGGRAGRYDKMHRVPFGEYVPLRDYIPWLEKFAPYDFDYSIVAGKKWTRFPLGSQRFGVLICYEDTDAALARRYATTDADGPPVDFLVNISNDGWFDGTSEHDEHLAICRFRAIECRRSVVRAVNMGISAIIDSNGRIRALPGPDWGGSKKVAAVLTGTVPIDSRNSNYARFGDWFAWLCWALVGFGAIRCAF
jgi:apolipoprotein N-acyltransferase